ncbi:MAG: Rne/Rng family ribonuclease [Rhodobacterales bacterium]|nr:Rne/Rng family ribonuclease [Rhodobacterales bacterium]
MAKKMLIDATHAEETRVVVVDGNKVEEFDFESENRRQLAGNIYLAKVTRVEPSLQAAFVDYGGNRHGFLAFSEIHADYYQIPIADRQALLEEERLYAEAMKAREEEEESNPKPKRSRSRGGRSRSSTKAADATTTDAVATKDVADDSPENGADEGMSGMETIDLGDVTPEGTSPMEIVAETPVEEPSEAVAENAQEAPEETADIVPVAAQENDEDSNGADTVVAPDEDAVEILADDDEIDKGVGPDASAKDSSIVTVADDDDSADIRPPRKPRVKRYRIQEVIKVRQILLVQVVKEERGNKGAALTTYLSLAGRYCVLMPNTARGGGISRKITNAVDRKKLKEIANEIDVPVGAGLIVRTAGAKRTKSEIKRDYEYLLRLWEQIRELTLKSTAPAKIYEEGDLIKRSIRDLYNRDIDEVFVEGEAGYRIAKDFMKMIMPSHAKNVKRYTDQMPLFARYQVESYLSSMFNPTVQLKSGGYIVIGVTEALVAIDVNSGRATKENSIEETATKTNLEAAEEVARQLRLRDLAGLIVIDFIDMDDRRNNAAVEKRMKDKLKTDRARIQVGRISGFGLMEMSRQRLRPGMIETTTQPCPSCHGTGLIRSDDNLALSILRQIEEEGVRRRSREVLVKCPIGISNFIMNQKREHIAQIEARYGLSVRVEGDPQLISPDFAIEKFKTATRVVAKVAAHVVSVDTTLMDQIDEDIVVEEDVEAPVEAVTSDEEQRPKKRRRRRRRRSKSSNGAVEGAANSENGNSENGNSENADSENGAAVSAQAGESGAESAAQSPAADAAVESGSAPVQEASDVSEAKAENVVNGADVATSAEAETAPEADAKPKKRTRTRTRKKPVTAKVEDAVTTETAAQTDEVAAPATEDADKPAVKKKAATRKPASKAKAKPKTTRTRTSAAAKKKAAEAEALAKAGEPAAPVADVAPEPAAEVAPEPATAPEPAKEPVLEAAPEVAVEVVAEKPAKPKRKGWWSLGR